MVEPELLGKPTETCRISAKVAGEILPKTMALRGDSAKVAMELSIVDVPWFNKKASASVAVDVSVRNLPKVTKKVSPSVPAESLGKPRPNWGDSPAVAVEALPNAAAICAVEIRAPVLVRGKPRPNESPIVASEDWAKPRPKASVTEEFEVRPKAAAI